MLDSNSEMSSQIIAFALELRRWGYAAKSQWLEFKARAIACYQAASPALARICGRTRLMPLPCRRGQIDPREPSIKLDQCARIPGKLTELAETELPSWGGRTRTRKCRRKISL
jgi:hypothetical protein